MEQSLIFGAAPAPSMVNPQAAGNELWRRKPAAEPPHGLPPDQAPWLEIARKVNTVGFKDMDDCLRNSLWIGLRSIDHMECRRAALKVAPKQREIKKKEGEDE